MIYCSVFRCWLRKPSKMWRTAFWMKHWGHSNFKRTKLWSTSFAVWRFNLGRLIMKKHCNEKTTARKYVSKTSGKQGYTGTKDLKQTQSFGELALFDLSLFNGVTVSTSFFTCFDQHFGSTACCQPSPGSILQLSVPKSLLRKITSCATSQSWSWYFGRTSLFLIHSYTCWLPYLGLPNVQTLKMCSLKSNTSGAGCKFISGETIATITLLFWKGKPFSVSSDCFGELFPTHQQCLFDLWTCHQGHDGSWLSGEAFLSKHISLPEFLLRGLHGQAADRADRCCRWFWPVGWCGHSWNLIILEGIFKTEDPGRIWRGPCTLFKPILEWHHCSLSNKRDWGERSFLVVDLVLELW